MSSTSPVQSFVSSLPKTGDVPSKCLLGNSIWEAAVEKRLKSCHPSKMELLEEHPDNKQLREVIERSITPTLIDLDHYLQDLLKNFESCRIQDSTIGTIESLTLDVGDVHPGGKATAIIHTNSADYVYRPRALSYEKAFTMLLEEMRQEVDIPVQKSIFGSTFTLSHFIEKKEPSPKNIQRDFRRLIFLQYMASICSLTDLHFENFIFSEEGLIPLDLEAYSGFSDELFQMKTSIFPEYNHLYEGKRYDISPLSQLLDIHEQSYDQIAEFAGECFRELASYQDKIHAIAHELFSEELVARRVHRATMDYSSIVRYIDNLFFEGKDKKEILLSHIAKKNPKHLDEVLPDELDALIRNYIPVFYDSIGESVPKQLSELRTSRAASERRLYVASEYVTTALQCYFLNRTYPADSKISLSSLPSICQKIRVTPKTPNRQGAEDRQIEKDSIDIFHSVLQRLRAVAEHSLHPEEMFVGTNTLYLFAQEIPGQIGEGIYSGIDGILMYLSQAATQHNMHQKEVLQLVIERKARLLDKILENGDFDGLASGYSSCLYATIFSLLSLGEETQALEISELFISRSFPSEQWDSRQIDLLGKGLGYILGITNIASIASIKVFKKQTHAHISQFLDFIENKYLLSEQRNIGFTHGDAGLLYTLVRIGQVFSEFKVTQLIEEVIDRIFNSYEENEYRFRDYNRDDNFNGPSYCNGVSGVFLACNVTLQCELKQEARDKLMKMTDEASALLHSSTEMATEICCSSLYPRLFSRTDDVVKPTTILTKESNYSLFKGKTGLGYMLLETLSDRPNILLFDLPTQR